MNKQDDYSFFIDNIAPHYKYIIDFLTFATSSDKELTEDIAQDTMETAWKSLEKFREYRNIRGALKTTAERKLKKHYKSTVKFVLIEEYEDIESCEKDIEEILIEIETGEELKKILQKLGKKYARVLILRHYYDMSLKGIADISAVNYNTVQSWYTRAKKMMNEICTENEDF